MSPPVRGQSIREYDDLRTLDDLPVSEREMEAAFEASRSQACDLLPKGEAVEFSSFVTVLTARDRREARGKRLLPATRQHLFSVGLEFEPDDRATLPLVSRGTIVDYLEKNFVSIQARVRKDLLDDEHYFHHRPIAATASFRGSRLTQPFEPLVSAHTRNFHSLGLFCRAEELARKEAADFRTLVLLFKVDLQQPGQARKNTSFEYVFVRGIATAPGDGLNCHVFVTDRDRTRVSYLRSTTLPNAAARCSILGRIAVTEFDSTGVYPTEAVTRTYSVDQRKAYDMQRLDEYTAAQNWSGGFARNLDRVLDAIIVDGLEGFGDL